MRTAFLQVVNYVSSVIGHINNLYLKGNNLRSMYVLGGITVALLIAFYGFILPPLNFPSGEMVEIPKGASVQATARFLQSQGIVRSGMAFRLGMKVFGGQKGVLYGDYIFKEPVSLFTVVDRVSTGAFGLDPITVRIPEGATLQEMSVILAKRLPRFSAEKFIAKTEGKEGFLFPDTYFFLPNSNEDLVIETLTDSFNKIIAPLQADIEKSGRTLEDVVVLASIIEREARVYERKRVISGIMWRRIKIGMPLQVDATFVYFLGKNSYTLTLKDLRIDHPFNTYKHKGLPPGAISNPGLASLKAAVYPTESVYLFWLDDSNGNTYFSSTYAEHLRYKQLYLP
jgi:UPF0755 protein